MYVEVTNITDGPGYQPENVDLYTKTLSPGETIKIPAELVDSKLRRLAEGVKPKVAIGQAPSWYLASKIRRGKELSAEEVQRRFAARSPTPTPPPSNVVRLEMHDELAVADELALGGEKRERKSKGR